MTAMPLALADSLESAGLPSSVRNEIDLLANLLRDIIQSPHGSKAQAYESAARQMQAAGYKVTWHGIRALLPLFRAEGWHALIDRRKVPHSDKNRLPAAFVQEMKRRSERQGRSTAQAREELLQTWRSGKPIPGYPIHPAADPFTGHPAGWSLANLRRAARSTAFEKKAMRIGLGYAKAKHGPKHFTSRQGLHHLSHVMFDDVVNDNFVYVGQRNQMCRVSQVGALDVYSGNYFCYGTHPQLKRWDAKQGKFVTDSIKEANMRFLVAFKLYAHGYSPLGTEYVIERGTATLREDIIALLHDRTKAIHGEAMITVNLGGWTGKKQIVDGMFAGKGGGNPRHKAHLEAWHNLLHNATASLPGQTGPDVERRPEQLDGMLKANKELMELATQLTPWQRDQIKYPLLEYHTQFVRVLAGIIDLINKRTTHDLEGWEACDFLTNEYRFHRESNDWLNKKQYLALPDTARFALSEIVKADLACQRPRKLSPHEVFTMNRDQAVRAPVALIAELLYADLAQEHKCRNGYFEIGDKEIDPEPMLFDSRIITTDGREEELTPDTYEVIINPFQPEMLWVYSGKRGRGAFLGIARRTAKASRADKEANLRNLGAEQARYRDLAAPLVARHADIARDEAKRLRNSSDVIAGPRSPDEARVIEMREQSVADAESDFDAPAPASVLPAQPSTTPTDEDDFA